MAPSAPLSSGRCVARNGSFGLSERESPTSKLGCVQPSDDPSRTTQLLAERWATRFSSIQRRVSQGDALKFVGAGIVAAAWFTFVILAKGTTDFQSSDLVIPGVLTVIGIVIGGFGFSRDRRARRELKDATAGLARDLDTRPTSRPELEQSEPPRTEPERRSVWP